MVPVQLVKLPAACCALRCMFPRTRFPLSIKEASAEGEGRGYPLCKLCYCWEVRGAGCVLLIDLCS